MTDAIVTAHNAALMARLLDTAAMKTQFPTWLLQLLNDAADALAAPSQAVVSDVPRVSTNATDADLLGYFDDLLNVQGRLMFAKNDYNVEEAEAFGVALMDFMRLHGVRVRSLLTAALKGENDGRG